MYSMLILNTTFIESHLPKIRNFLQEPKNNYLYAFCKYRKNPPRFGAFFHFLELGRMHKTYLLCKLHVSNICLLDLVFFCLCDVAGNHIPTLGAHTTTTTQCGGRATQIGYKLCCWLFGVCRLRHASLAAFHAHLLRRKITLCTMAFVVR